VWRQSLYFATADASEYPAKECIPLLRTMEYLMLKTSLSSKQLDIRCCRPELVYICKITMLFLRMKRFIDRLVGLTVLAHRVSVILRGYERRDVCHPNNLLGDNAPTIRRLVTLSRWGTCSRSRCRKLQHATNVCVKFQKFPNSDKTGVRWRSRWEWTTLSRTHLTALFPVSRTGSFPQVYTHACVTAVWAYSRV